MDGLSDLALSDFFAPFPAALLALSLGHKKRLNWYTVRGNIKSTRQGVGSISLAVTLSWTGQHACRPC